MIEIKKNRMFRTLAAVCSAVYLMTGCGSTAQGGSATIEGMESKALDSFDGQTGLTGTDEYETDNDAILNDAGGDTESLTDRAEDAPSDSTDKPDTAETKKKLDREKIVSIETKEWDRTLQEIKSAIEKSGGIIQSENEYYDRDSDWYNTDQISMHFDTITLRVPAENFEQLISSVGEIGKTVSKDIQADNITASYYDVKARLETKEKELQQLNELLARAEKMKDVLSITDQITSVQYEIESAKSQLENMDLDVAYSTLTIEIREVSQYSRTTDSAGTWFSETFIGAGRFFIDFLKAMFCLVIYLGPCAAVIIAVIIPIRRFIKKHKKPKKNVYRPGGYWYKNQSQNIPEDENTDGTDNYDPTYENSIQDDFNETENGNLTKPEMHD